MRIFHFGQIKTVKDGTIGEYALHVQCPWRIEGPQGIVTGRSDLWEPTEADADFDWDSWDYEKDGNLQDKLIGSLLGEYDPQTNLILPTVINLLWKMLRWIDTVGLALLFRRIQDSHISRRVES